MQVVGQDGHQRGERDRGELLEPEQLLVVLALARAVLAAAELEHHRVVALQLGEPVHDTGVVRQLEVGQHGADGQSVAHGVSSGVGGCRRRPVRSR